MLLRTLILLVLAISARAAATDVCVFHWQEEYDQKRSRKITAFFIAPKAVKELFDASARGDDKAVDELGAALPSDAWDCIVELRGEEKIYPKDRITLMYVSPPKTIVEIRSGTVEVDRTKRRCSLR